MLSSLCWISGSSVKSIPSKNQDDLEEIKDEEISSIMKNKNKKKKKKKEEKINNFEDEEEQLMIKELNLNDYDNEDDRNFGLWDVESGLYYKDNNEDPYLTMKDDEEELSDIEDYTIKPSDAIIVALHSEEEDLSHLDVCIYEPQEDNLYVHHDILLSSFPLCIAWSNWTPHNENHGNLVAVGSFDPAIEIWDLDILDPLKPLIILGGEKKDHKKKKTKKHNIEYLPDSHTSAILGLSWNIHAKNILASCSADETIKIWDLQSQKCLQTFNHHKDKVQSIAWHNIEPTILASGSFDGTVKIVDVRYPKEGNKIIIGNSIEGILWNLPLQPEQLLVSTEIGIITCHDVRMLPKDVKKSKTLWTLNAHNKEVSAMSLNSIIPGFLATGSTDKYLKLWDLQKDQPTCLYSTKLKNAIFSLSFYHTLPFLLAVGTSTTIGNEKEDNENNAEQEKLKIYNTLDWAAINHRFNK